MSIQAEALLVLQDGQAPHDDHEAVRGIRPYAMDETKTRSEERRVVAAVSCTSSVDFRPKMRSASPSRKVLVKRNLFGPVVMALPIRPFSMSS